MKLYFLDRVDSTQRYLKEYVKKNDIDELICFYTNHQTNGVGSRDNQWDGKEGNLFFSFAYKLSDLPEDLSLSSASIYFSYQLKEKLQSYGSKLWIKWPNDFYIDTKKIGGTITQIDTKFLYCGIGLNLIQTSSNYGYLDIKIDSKIILEQFLSSLKKDILWKQIFSKYRLEFELSRGYKTTVENDKISLKDALLLEDGSIEIEGKKVFSLR